MSAQRPAWCPDKQCRPLARTSRDQICAGAPGDHGRVCCNFRKPGGGIFAFDNVSGQDITDLRGLVDALDDDRIARGERGNE